MGKKAATKAWSHPRLGDFAAGEPWVRKLKIREFAAFSYDTGYSNARRSTGNVAFHLRPQSINGELKVPTPGMIAVVDRILDDPAAIVQKVIAALWEEFNGRGPDSGMWWHGSLVKGSESFDSLGEPPASARDVLQMLRLSDILIFNDEWNYSKPIAILSFSASFEEEHGVDVLTDGVTILGTGYIGDTQVWEHLRTP
jgi:hypothetical protein